MNGCMAARSCATEGRPNRARNASAPHRGRSSSPCPSLTTGRGESERGRVDEAIGIGLPEGGGHVVRELEGLRAERRVVWNPSSGGAIRVSS